ncbi:MAG TPA: Mur ligase family protein [Patescibacteria group bacterium]|nr:Mur ligase family protein [Patescibacteria group bacterium]
MFDLKRLPSWLHSAKSIAIVGFGREGQSTYRFIRNFFPQVPIWIFDEDKKLEPTLIHLHDNDINLKYSLGIFLLPPFDVVFKTPGIAQSKLHYKNGRAGTVTSQVDLFTQIYGKQVIAVTGTKGKSTTSALIAHLLNSLGQSAILAGNIGLPVLEILDQIEVNTHVVLELSAFQSETITAPVHIAVFTSLYPEHLDYYKDYDAYRAAKKHVFDLQTAQDIAVVPNDPAIIPLVSSRAKIITVQRAPSVHQTNINLAVTAVSVLGYTREEVLQHAQTFTPLPGRLEKIATVGSIEFYDDALATIPQATIAALDTLGDKVSVLIVGGHERAQDYSELAARIKNSSVKTVICFPSTGKRIGDELEQIQAEQKVFHVDSMKQAVAIAYKEVGEGIVLLSAGAPSFGIFIDYRDRSAQFRQCIENLSQHQ